MDRFHSDTREIVSLYNRHALTISFASKHKNAGMPSLEQVLKHIGPLPREALFLGQAEDDSPVLLDLHDPVPGPLLIVGNDGAGKTLFLRSIAQFVILTHTPKEIQFGVITNRVHEWQNALADSLHCVGVFASDRAEAKQFVQSLAMWLSTDRTSDQSVLMLIDGLDELSCWDEITLASLYKVFAHGTRKRVWPIATLHPRYCTKVNAWRDLFNLQMPSYGLAKDEVGMTFDIPQELWNSHVDGPWYTLKEQAGWIRFWIPSVSIQ